MNVEISRGPGGTPILQRITGGFRHGMFCNTLEEQLRRVIHQAMLSRVGLPWPAPLQYWSSDRNQQNRNRKIYHGLRLASLSVMNRLISEALEEGADQEAVKVARRFRFHDRYAIYCASVRSRRVLQIAVEFPALALAIIKSEPPLEDQLRELADTSICAFDDWLEDKKRTSAEAKDLVDAGAPLKTIASLMRIPMALRKVKPGAADLALNLVHALRDPRLLHAHMPRSLPRMKLWLRSMGVAAGAGPEFATWTAKNCLEVQAPPKEVLILLEDVRNWAEACHRASVPAHSRSANVGQNRELLVARGEEFVDRPLSQDMGLKAVIKLSHAWHEAVAENMSGLRFSFPEPWCKGGYFGGYSVLPIERSGRL